MRARCVPPPICSRTTGRHWYANTSANWRRAACSGWKAPRSRSRERITGARAKRSRLSGCIGTAPADRQRSVERLTTRASGGLAGREEVQHLHQQFSRCFLGNVVAARQRAAADIACHATPFVERLEALRDHAVPPP